MTMQEHVKIPKEVEAMLGANETVYAKAKQSRFRPGGKEVNPSEVFITNTRLISYEHKFFGRGNLTDLHYGDVANARLHKGIFSNEIHIIPRFEGVEHVKISAIKKDQAYDIVKLINDGIQTQGRRI